MITLYNRNFTQIDTETFRWSKVAFKYKNSETIYKLVKKTRGNLKDKERWFFGKTFYEVEAIAEIEKDGALKEEKRSFLCIWDKETSRIYTHEYYKGKGFAGISRTYRKSCGDVSITSIEEDEVASIQAIFELQGNGGRYKVYPESRKKVIEGFEHLQRYNLGNRRQLKFWREFLQEKNIHRKDLKGEGVEIHPDLIVETRNINPRGRKMYMFVELELHYHMRRDFYYKLEKLRRMQVAVYFIFNDYTLDWHLKLIDEHCSDYGEFNSLYYCKLSDFYKHSGDSDIREVFTRLM